MTIRKENDNTTFKDVITAQRSGDILEQFQYNINTYTLETTVNNGGTVTQSEGMCVLSTGTNADGDAMIQSKKPIRYRPGYEGYAYFTVLFENPAHPNTIQYAGPFNNDDGYFFGYRNEDLVVGRRNSGVDTVVTQDNWNGRTRTGTLGKELKNLDLTKLNIIRITWGWLGTAPIRFEISGSDGEWMTLHTMNASGTLTKPTILNPVLPICIDVDKTGGDSTDVVVKSASWSGGVIGIDTHQADRYFTGSVGGTYSTEAVMINFRNVSTFQSISNKVKAEGVKLSMSADGTKPARIKIYKNLTITSPTWTPVDSTNSIMETDTVGTVTPSDANLLFEYDLAKDDSLLDDISNLDFFIFPGETVTITGQSGASSDLRFTARWRELF